MRAMKFDQIVFVAIASAILFAMGFATTAGAAATDTAAAKATETVAIKVAQAADTHLPRSDLAATRTNIPYRQAGEGSHDIRFASFSPAPAAQAATAQPQQVPRNSTKDLLLLTLVGGMLVAYQLLRKHRLLRQQPFSL